MPNDFADPNFLIGVQDPYEQKPDTEHRSWGRTAVDLGIKAAEPIVGGARTLAQGARAISNDPRGNAADIETALGGAEDWMKGQLSPRQQALDTSKYIPNGPDERSAWRDPMSNIASTVAGLIPGGVAAKSTGLIRNAALRGAADVGFTAGATIGAGESVNAMRSFTDNTPIEELKKLEPFQAALREFNGDEKAARDKLFRDSFDLIATATEAGANALSFGVLARALKPGQGQLGNLIKRVALGGTEGGLAGAAEGGTGAYTEQLGKTRMGRQSAIDVGEVISGAAEGAIQMALPIAGAHAVRRGTPAIGTDTRTVADAQLNPPPEGAIETGAPPPPQAPPPAPPPTEGPPPPPTQGPEPPPTQGPPPPPTQAPSPMAGVWAQARPEVQQQIAGAPPTPTPEPAVAPSEAAPPAPAAQAPVTPGVDERLPSPVVQLFRTALGSTYRVHEDGSTTRDKAPRPENPDDAGPQPRSGVTFYVTPEQGNVLAEVQAQGGAPRVISLHERTGKIGMRYTAGPHAGKFERRTLVDFQQQPSVGMLPVEVWPDGRVHFGNEIVDVSRRRDQLAQEPPPAEPVPAPPAQAPAGAPPPDLGRAPPVTEAPLPATQAPEVTAPAAPAEAPRAAEPPPRAAEAPPAPLPADLQAIEAELAARPPRPSKRQQRAALEQPATPAPPAATPSPAPAEPRPGTMEDRLDPETRRLMEDVKTRVLAEKADEAAKREAKRKELEKVTPPARTGRKPTGFERALDVDLKRYKEKPTAAQWMALRGRARMVDERRRAGGLAPVYEQRLGQRPPEARQTGVNRAIAEREARRGAAAITFEREAHPREQQLIEDVAKLARGEGDKAEALTRAREIDEQRRAEGLDAPFEGAVEAATRAQSEIDNLSPEQRFNHEVAQLGHLRNVDPNVFANLEAVKRAADMLREINGERIKNNERPLPMPEWMSQKIEGRTREGLEPLDPVVKAANAYRTAKSLSDYLRQKSSKESQNEVSADKWDKSAKAEAAALTPAVAEEHRRETLSLQRIDRGRLLETARQKLVRKTAEVRERVAAGKEPLRSYTERERGKYVRKTETLPNEDQLQGILNKLVEKFFETGYHTSAAAKSREPLKEWREKGAKLGLIKTLRKHFGDNDGFKKFLNELSGEGGPQIYPKAPEVLTRRTKAFSKSELATFTNAEKEFQKEVDLYWFVKEKQLEAARRLQPILAEMVQEVRAGLVRAKAESGSKGARSIEWQLPSVERSATTGRPVIRAGKADPTTDYYNFAIDVMKINEELKLVNAATDPARFRQEGSFREMLTNVPERQRELRLYVNRTSKIVQNFARHLDAFSRGDMAEIRQERRQRTAEVDEGFLRQEFGGDDELSSLEQLPDDVAFRAGAFEETKIEDQIALREQAAQRIAQRQGNITEQERRFARIREENPELYAKLQAHAANRRNRPHDGPVPATAVEMRNEISDARQALLTADPNHPLISDPEPAQVTLDRAKALIKSGDAEVSSFVTPEFLDKLAKVNQGVGVLHTTLDVSRDRSGTAGAFYQPVFDRVVLSNDVSGHEYVQSAIHEHVHAATEGLLQRDDAFRTEVGQLLDRATDYARRTQMDMQQRPLYGLTNPSEFLAETVSNQQFRQFLGRVPASDHGVIQGAKNALNAFYRTVRDAWRRATGTQRDADTALDALYYDQSTVLGRADAMVERTMRRLEQEGRSPLEFNEKGQPANFERRYMPIPGERFVRSFNPRGYANQTIESVKRAWDNRDRNRGLGMSLHTTDQLTRRAEPAFQEVTAPILDIMSKVFTERTRMLREHDQPRLLKTHEWLNGLSSETRAKVEKFLIDETYHGAYADVELSHRKNAHVSNAGLADEQVRREHPKIRERYNELLRTQGFEENRNDLHQFFRDRELDIRNTVVRHNLERTDVIPDTITGRAREDILNRLQAYIFPTVDRAPDELRDWRKQQRDELKALGVDLGNRKVRDEIADIRNAPEFRQIAGPYFPLVRHGTQAVSGTFEIPTPVNATRFAMKTDRLTGQPVDDGTFLFNSEQEAKDFIGQVTDRYGLTQLGGGVAHIDPRTGERAMKFTEQELEQLRQRAIEEKQPEPRNMRLSAKEAQERMQAGGPVQEKHFVTFQNKLLEFHQGYYDAKKSVDAWRERYGDELKITEPEDVHKKTGKENERYVSQQMQRLIDRMEASRSYQSLSDAEQVAIKHSLTLAAAKSVMRRGVRQRFQPRQYVAGANTDVMRNFADYSGVTAGYLARMKHMTETDRATKELNDYVEAHRYQAGDANANARVRVRAELLQRLHQPTESFVDSVFDRAVDRVLKFSMFDKLMGLSYLTINATEASLVGGPLMVGKHNPARVIGAIAGAYRLANAAKFVGYGARDVTRALKGDMHFTNYRQKFIDSVAGQPDEAGLRQMFDHLQERGLFEATAGIEYQRVFLSARSKLDKAADYLSNVFQGANTAVENLNRFVVATAAYRLERAAGRSHDEAVKYATTMTYKANGQYANFNSPELFNRNPVWRMALQFKKYPQRIMANYIEAAIGAARGDKDKIRQLAAMLAMQGMVAGMLGLPTEIFSIPINALNIAGITPFNWDDAQAGFRRMAADQFGAKTGELISHGLLQATGLSVAGRLGQDNMLTYGSPASTKVQDLKSGAMGLITGAGGGLAADFITGLQKATDAARSYSEGATAIGNRQARDAARFLIPLRAVTDVIDAVSRSEPEGMRTQTGRQMREPYSIPEAIARGIGFTPAREAEAGEARRAVQRAATQYKAERKGYLDRWVQSTPAEQQMMWPSIQQWNADKPAEQKLSRGDLLRAQGTRTKAEKQSPDKLGLSLDRQTEPFIKRSQIYGI